MPTKAEKEYNEIYDSIMNTIYKLQENHDNSIIRDILRDISQEGW